LCDFRNLRYSKFHDFVINGIHYRTKTCFALGLQDRTKIQVNGFAGEKISQ
jgi:hypothetical protein